MESIFYYLCCFGCFGFCCSPKYVKRDDPKEKKTTSERLEAITPTDSALRSTASNPSDMKTEEISNFHEIPNDKFKTSNEVIASYGYSLGKELGAGASGHVYKVTHTPSKNVIAVKICTFPQIKDKTTRKERQTVLKTVKNELFILEKLKHPHVIQMIQHFVIVEKKLSTIYIFMHYAEGGDLASLMTKSGPFDENTTKIWFSQMLSALVYMHNKHIAHRDLKPSNILLDKYDNVLISDFGLSRVMSTKADIPIESSTYCGTGPYMPPEMLEKVEYKEKKFARYDAFRVDVWSLAVILFNLLTSTFPFLVPKGESRAKAIKRMRRKKWSFDSTEIKSPPTSELKTIMNKMFEPNPIKRATMTDLTREPWIIKEYKTVEQNYKK